MAINRFVKERQKFDDKRIKLARIRGQVKKSSVRKLTDLLEKHPEDSVAVLRSWINSKKV